MIDPRIHPATFVAYLIVVGLILIMPTALRRAREYRELVALRNSIMRQLISGDGPFPSESAARARLRIEALIDCRLRKHGNATSRPGFLCCADDGVTVLAGSEVVRSLSYGRWQWLGLTDSRPNGPFSIALEDAEGKLTIEVGRADDLVRLVNIVANHSVPTRFMRT